MPHSWSCPTLKSRPTSSVKIFFFFALLSAVMCSRLQEPWPALLATGKWRSNYPCRVMTWLAQAKLLLEWQQHVLFSLRSTGPFCFSDFFSQASSILYDVLTPFWHFYLLFNRPHYQKKITHTLKVGQITRNSNCSNKYRQLQLLTGAILGCVCIRREMWA